MISRFSVRHVSRTFGLLQRAAAAYSSTVNSKVLHPGQRYQHLTRSAGPCWLPRSLAAELPKPRDSSRNRQGLHCAGKGNIFGHQLHRIKTKKPCQGRVSFGLTGACNTLSQGLGEISALAGWDTRPGKPILSRKLSPVQLPASPDTSSRRLESRCFGPGKVIATDQGDLFTVAGIAGQVRPARARRQWQGSVKPQPRALSLS